MSPKVTTHSVSERAGFRNPGGPLATSKPHTRRLLRIGVATSHYDAAAALREAGADQVVETLGETVHDQQLAQEGR